MKLYPWFEVARQESLKSRHRHKLGACIIGKGGKLLSTGFNQVRHCGTGKRFAKWPSSLCCERDAIRKLDKGELKGSTLFVFRQFADGRSALAMPCSACLELIEFVSIKRVYFTTNNFPFYGELRL